MIDHEMARGKNKTEIRKKKQVCMSPLLYL